MSHQLSGFNRQANKLPLILLAGTFSLFLFTVIGPLFTVFATTDPLSVPNNKFGIHILSGDPQEIKDAAALVNSHGDWGYVTVLIADNDRDQKKWQTIFDEFRRQHLISIVRIATQPGGNNWQRPYDGEENAWADFLNTLNWPTQNRYVVVYNEPNHASEWGGSVDAVGYAKVLDKTIKALKAKDPNFFVLNAGLDASAPNKIPNFEDELLFLQQMNQAIPGIFNELDGWTSHSYPNPNFAGLPTDSGRGTIKTYDWELQSLAGLGLTKKLPVFITETGWQHSDGLVEDSNLPSSDTVSKYYQQAFENVWNDRRIVAVTPFLLDYQEAPFDHFSFKKVSSTTSGQNVLGASFPDFYPQYQKITDIPKSDGHPVQNINSQLVRSSLPTNLIVGQNYLVSLTFKNTGQSIWNESGKMELAIQDNQDQLADLSIPAGTKIEPGGQYNFNFNLTIFEPGVTNLKVDLADNGQHFPSKNFRLVVNVLSTLPPSPQPQNQNVLTFLLKLLGFS